MALHTRGSAPEGEPTRPANTTRFDALESLRAIAGFLFGLIPSQSLSVVPAGWSIGVEMIFYLLFPIVAACMRTTRASALAFGLSVVVSLAARAPTQEYGLFTLTNVITNAPYFLAGVLAYRIWQRHDWARTQRASLLLMTGAVTTAAVIVWSGSLNGGGRIIWAVVFAMFVIAASTLPLTVMRRGPLRRLGRISFSLYLLHPLVIFILDHAEVPDLVVEALDASVAATFAVYALLTIAAVWCVSELTYRFVEARGVSLGESVVALARSRSDAPAERKNPTASA